MHSYVSSETDFILSNMAFESALRFHAYLCQHLNFAGRKVQDDAECAGQGTYI